jgi:phosphonoacetaldehyde hydrolase
MTEGLNAGMWTIGLAKTGNEMGMTAEEIARLSRSELERRLSHAYARLRAAGAHYVVDSIADVPPILDEIENRLAAGEPPDARVGGVEMNAPANANGSALAAP